MLHRNTPLTQPHKQSSLVWFTGFRISIQSFPSITELARRNKLFLSVLLNKCFQLLCLLFSIFEMYSSSMSFLYKIAIRIQQSPLSRVDTGHIVKNELTRYDPIEIQLDQSFYALELERHCQRPRMIIICKQIYSKTFTQRSSIDWSLHEQWLYISIMLIPDSYIVRWSPVNNALRGLWNKQTDPCGL